MQTARGASLNASDSGEEPDRAGDEATAASAGTATGRPRLLLLLAVALGAWLVDLVTKVLAVDKLSGREPVHVVGDLLRLTLTRNPGAAFSTGTSYTLVLSLVAILAVLVLLFFARRVRDLVWALAFGLLLAGVAGNLTDRIFRDPAPLRGHVVDFVQLPHWPVFNVADICINLAAVLILVQAVRGVRLDGTRAQQ